MLLSGGARHFREDNLWRAAERLSAGSPQPSNIFSNLAQQES
jgi:hypothetical protein